MTDRRGFVAVILAGGLLAGCSLLPSSGPSPQAVLSTASSTTNAPAPYVLVKLTPDIVARIGQRRSGGFSALGSTSATAPHVMLGVGDVVSVTIFEAAAGGLFIPSQGGARPGNFVELPDQLVDNAGNITVPYAGAIKAAGRGIPEIQADIVSRLRDRAIEPQVVITLRDQKSSQVSVLGEVNSPARFPINPSGDRILDVIARAGGPKYPDYETFVTLQRGHKEGTELFTDLANRPPDNVFARPGDIVIVSRRPQSFVAFGASGKNGQFPFDAEEVTLSEALGKAGGLLDARANPTYVFLYRLENRRLLEQIGYPADRFGNGPVPTIYMVDLRDPSGYFLTSKFDIEDKDVVYATDAPSTDLGKVFGVVRGTTETANSVTSL